MDRGQITEILLFSSAVMNDGKSRFTWYGREVKRVVRMERSAQAFSVNKVQNYGMITSPEHNGFRR